MQDGVRLITEAKAGSLNSFDPIRLRAVHVTLTIIDDWGERQERVVTRGI